MFGIQDLALFMMAGWILIVTPGPDTAYIIGRSVQLGWRGGVAAALGIGSGCLVHVFGAAIGLSAIIATSSIAFTAVKLIGAAYLCYIGIRMLLSRGSTLNADATPDGMVSPREIPLRQVFWQGALTNVLNPKVALFFLAFLPQFVDTASPHKAAAFLLLGLIFVINGTLWCLGVAAFAAKVGDVLKRSRNALTWIDRALGGLFVALGVRLALSEAR